MTSADLWQQRGEGGKTEEDFKVIWDATAGILKEQLSVHKLLEMTFTPSSPQTCGR